MTSWCHTAMFRLVLLFALVLVRTGWCAEDDASTSVLPETTTIELGTTTLAITEVTLQEVSTSADPGVAGGDSGAVSAITDLPTLLTTAVVMASTKAKEMVSRG